MLHSIIDGWRGAGGRRRRPGLLAALDERTPGCSGAFVFNAIAGVQKSGGRAAYIDVSQRLDIGEAVSAGVDAGSIVFSQPDSAESALSICASLVESGAIDLVVVDSAASMASEEEMDIFPADEDEAPPAIDLLVADISEAAAKTGATCLFTGMERTAAGREPNASTRELRKKAACSIAVSSDGKEVKVEVTERKFRFFATKSVFNLPILPRTGRTRDDAARQRTPANMV